MVHVTDTDPEQTVIVVTHPRAQTQNQNPSQHIQVHVVPNSNLNALGLTPPRTSMDGLIVHPNDRNSETS